MAGPVIIVLVLLVGIPVGVMVAGAALAVVLGMMLRRNGEVLHEGSELIELNR